jgi:hypothetical protein
MLMHTVEEEEHFDDGWLFGIYKSTKCDLPFRARVIFLLLPSPIYIIEETVMFSFVNPTDIMSCSSFTTLSLS